MVTVEARIKVKGKQYEISVDLDEALKVRKGTGNVHSALNSDNVYYDLKKGTLASHKDLEDGFGTIDVYSIAEKIMKDGEIQKTQEFRDSEKEFRLNRLVALIVKNAVDQHDRPFTEDRIRKAIEEAHCKIESNRPVEVQMIEIVEELKKLIPIKIERKKIKITIPARFSGQVYGTLKDYKISEEWLANGDLQAIISIPSGMQIDFYEKLNNITHGAVVSEEVRE